MKCNVGGMDKILRITLGIIVIILGIYFKSWWGLIGVILLVTGLLSWCPLYLPLGISTCKANSDKKR